MNAQTRLLALAAALAATACATDDTTAPDLAEVVSTAKQEDGSVTTVLDMGGGEMAVGTMESAGYAQPPAAGSTTLGQPGFDDYECDSFGTDWVADWKAAFAGRTKYREALYPHFYAPPYTFYPGASVYHGTNTNSKTYLGACNGDDTDTLILEIHRRIAGKWKKVLTVNIPSFKKYTFYSGVPAAYRGKTYGASGAVVEHYGVGAAWTLSPFVTTP